MILAGAFLLIVFIVMSCVVSFRVGYGRGYEDGMSNMSRYQDKLRKE